jgi:hypothetical protein
MKVSTAASPANRVVRDLVRPSTSADGTGRGAFVRRVLEPLLEGVVPNCRIFVTVLSLRASGKLVSVPTL